MELEIDKNIYIPLWLDLLYFIIIGGIVLVSHLHSTMVRFIIGWNAVKNFFGF